MSESPIPGDDKQEIKSLAEMPPTPLPAEESPRPGPPLFDCFFYTVVGAGTLILVSGMMTPCVGATRSAKLQWEERQAAIEKAIADAEARDAEQP